MSNKKVKGLLKGLRYISQIFESEKEQEIQIGCPTDVKHVAHIGWDGPSVNSPSWMNEFKTAPGFASAPMTLTGDTQSKAQDNNVKWVSEDTKRRSSRSVTQGRDLPELPKSSRRQTNTIDSPTRGKTRQSRKTSSNRPSNLKDSPDESKQELIMSNDSGELLLDGGSQAQNIPRKTRRKKSKDKDSSSGSSYVSSSSKLGSKTQQPSDPNLDCDDSTPTSKSSNKPSSFEENENCERGMTGVVS
ncbi:CRIB domain-containing protein RIC6 [Trifolium pratense]|nr:CRIB domain-containing protein RIC6 [Trifolium pratense]